MADSTTKGPVPQPKPSVTKVAFSGTDQDKFQKVVEQYQIEKRAGSEKESPREVEMVDTIVPVQFILTLDSHARVTVPIGYQTMPKEWAEHWFAQAHGVSMRDGDAPSPKEKAPVVSDQERVAQNVKAQAAAAPQAPARPAPPKP